MPLHNCKATAQFLSDYIQTDPHLERLQQENLERYKGEVDGNTSI